MKRLILEMISSVIHNEGQKTISMCKGLVQGKRSACVHDLVTLGTIILGGK